MTLKNRLIISFIIFVFLVITMGVILVTITNKSNQYLAQSRDHYAIKTLWDEINTNFEQLDRNINYFVILESESEKDKFDASKRLINNRYEEWQKKDFVGNYYIEKQEIENWYEDFKRFNDLCLHLFGSFKKINKFDFFENKIDPVANKLKNQINGNIKKQVEALRILEDNVVSLKTFSINISIFIGIISLFSALILSLMIVTSITKPLKTLQEFTQKVGKGSVGERLNLKSPEEIVNLANAFNNMLDDLNTSQLKIIQMDRMASIGELAGGVAHEINNPLTGILGQSQLLLTKLLQDSPYKSSIEKIEQAAQRCRVIVRSLLDFARDKEYKYKPTSVKELIDKTLELIETEATSKKIMIKKEPLPDLPTIYVSGGHIQQVFLNIITNAIHSMPDGGNLFITVDKNHQFIYISFRDTGTGIEKDVLSHIFTPFFTTKDIGEGYGLGLSVSYGIIQKHNGKIIAKSEGKNKGAEFIVALPI